MSPHVSLSNRSAGGVLPIPSFFDPANADKVYEPKFQEIANAARAWKKEHDIKPASQDQFKICLLGIDFQNTFCRPDYELFVAGRSGRGAIEDAIRWVQFIFKNLRYLTKLKLTMDTHRTFQIFTEMLLVNEKGEHPNALFCPEIPSQDIREGKWRISNEFAQAMAEFGVTYAALQEYLQHYVDQLESKGKFKLTIWPYHAMLGSLGHAIVSIIMEATFFHSVARSTNYDCEVKGGVILSENYSVVSPEVLIGARGEPIAQRNVDFFGDILRYDALILGGEAGSHCLGWTIQDILDGIMKMDPELAKKVYLMRDTTSAVVIPGVVDYTDKMNESFDRFAAAGMNIVDSTTPLKDWPGIKLA